MLTVNNKKTNKQRKQKQEEKKETCFLPRQIVPFPVKPSLQTQAYDPMLLQHSALSSHGLPYFEHSSMSYMKKKIKIQTLAKEKPHATELTVF